MLFRTHGEAIFNASICYKTLKAHFELLELILSFYVYVSEGKKC